MNLTINFGNDNNLFLFYCFNVNASFLRTWSAVGFTSFNVCVVIQLILVGDFLAITWYRHGTESFFKARRSSYWAMAHRSICRAAARRLWTLDWSFAVTAKTVVDDMNSLDPTAVFGGGTPVRSQSSCSPWDGQGWLGRHLGQGYATQSGRPMHLILRHSCCIPSFRTHLQPTIISLLRNSNLSNPAVDRYSSQVSVIDLFIMLFTYWRLYKQ